MTIRQFLFHTICMMALLWRLFNSDLQKLQSQIVPSAGVKSTLSLDLTLKFSIEAENSELLRWVLRASRKQRFKYYKLAQSACDEYFELQIGREEGLTNLSCSESVCPRLRLEMRKGPDENSREDGEAHALGGTMICMRYFIQSVTSGDTRKDVEMFVSASKMLSSQVLASSLQNFYRYIL